MSIFDHIHWGHLLIGLVGLVLVVMTFKVVRNVTGSTVLGIAGAVVMYVTYRWLPPMRNVHWFIARPIGFGWVFWAFVIFVIMYFLVHLLHPRLLWALALLLLFGALWAPGWTRTPHNNDGDTARTASSEPVGTSGSAGAPTPTTPVTPSSTAAPTVTVLPLPEAQVTSIVNAYMSTQGWKPEQLNVASAVDFTKNPEERGSAAFTGVTLKTQSDVAGFLSGASDKSKAAREYVLTALKGENQYERDRALNGTAYVAVQFKDSAVYAGTTYFQNGKIVTPSGPRFVEAGDVVWVYLRSDGKIIPEASIRADCGNPGSVGITPQPPATPKPPPIDQPPPTTTSTTVKPGITTTVAPTTTVKTTTTVAPTTTQPVTTTTAKPIVTTTTTPPTVTKGPSGTVPPGGPGSGGNPGGTGPGGDCSNANTRSQPGECSTSTTVVTQTTVKQTSTTVAANPHGCAADAEWSDFWGACILK